MNYYKNFLFLFFHQPKRHGVLLSMNNVIWSSPVMAHKEVGSVHDLILNKNTGYIIESWDELELKMNELYNNQELCDEFSKNAVKLMEKEWNYNLYKYNLQLSIKKSE